MAQVALITGCSRGIGQLTAQLFAARGWQVVATARNRADIDIDNVFPVALDVTDDASISSAVDAALARFGSIDVLVNNAGIGMLGPLEGSCAEELESHFRTNFFGPVSLIRQVLPTMRERQTGTIVNVSSIAGRIATPFMPAYHASKFALEGLSESLRYELAAHGIRVKLVEPGHFRTGFIARALRTRHVAYDMQFNNYMGWVEKEDAKAPGPAPVAEAIFSAATDKSDRLRYPVGGKLMLALVALFPDSMWRSLNMQGLTRPAH